MDIIVSGEKYTIDPTRILPAATKSEPGGILSKGDFTVSSSGQLLLSDTGDNIVQTLGAYTVKSIATTYDGTNTHDFEESTACTLLKTPNNVYILFFMRNSSGGFSTLRSYKDTVDLGEDYKNLVPINATLFSPQVDSVSVSNNNGIITCINQVTKNASIYPGSAYRAVCLVEA